MQSPPRPIALSKLPRQFAMSLDHPVLGGMTNADRNTAIRRLAYLLMEAAGADPGDVDHDER